MNNAEMENFKKCNPKNHAVGDVVYYVEKPSGKWRVDYGIVLENFASEIAIQRLEPMDSREIDGIPVGEYEFPSRWKKLPKNWTWNTTLFEVKHNEEKEKLKHTFPLEISDPEQVKLAYDAGVLVDVDKNLHGRFETEISKEHGWRIIHTYNPYFDYVQNVISLPYYLVYSTYEEAQAVVEENTRECEELANLTDYEWSLRELNNTLYRWAALYCKPDDVIDEYRERIMTMENFDNIEVRLSGGEIQWKYWNNKRWNTVKL